MNHDYAVMNDGTIKMVDDFEPGTLGLACHRGEVRKIVHIRPPRPFGKWREPSNVTPIRRREPVKDCPQPDPDWRPAA